MSGLGYCVFCNVQRCLSCILANEIQWQNISRGQVPQGCPFTVMSWMQINAVQSATDRLYPRYNKVLQCARTVTLTLKLYVCNACPSPLYLYNWPLAEGSETCKGPCQGRSWLVFNWPAYWSQNLIKHFFILVVNFLCICHISSC